MLFKTINFQMLCSPTPNNNERKKLHDIFNTTIEILEDDNDDEVLQKNIKKNN